MFEGILDLEAEARNLHMSMLEANNPAPINTRLNFLEAKLGRESLTSYPQYITLPLTNVCNARCVFCNYRPHKTSFFTRPDDFETMTWLRRVERINVNGGYGDSLANPHFGDVLEYLHTIAPYSRFSMTTNGIGLSEKLNDNIIKYMHYIRLSLNAHDRCNYNKYMGVRDKYIFDKIIDHIKYICDIKTDRLVIDISMIMTKDNIENLDDFIYLGQDLGVDFCTLVHYHPVSFYGKKHLNISKSLYSCKIESDKALRRAARLASECGIGLNRPAYFDEEPSPSPMRCWQPFNNCQLTHCATGEYGNDSSPCCTGYPLGITWSYDKLDEKFFMQYVWNNAMFRYMRRSQLDKSVQNEYCTTCLTHDIFNPEHTPHFITSNTNMMEFAHHLAKENPLHF